MLATSSRAGLLPTSRSPLTHGPTKPLLQLPKQKSCSLIVALTPSFWPPAATELAPRVLNMVLTLSSPPSPPNVDPCFNGRDTQNSIIATIHTQMSQCSAPDPSIAATLPQAASSILPPHSLIAMRHQATAACTHCINLCDILPSVVATSLQPLAHATTTNADTRGCINLCGLLPGAAATSDHQATACPG